MKTEWISEKLPPKEREENKLSGGIFMAVTVLFMSAMFFFGRAIGEAVHENSPVSGNADSGFSLSESILETESWGLGFGADGTQPTGNASASQLKE